MKRIILEYSNQGEDGLYDLKAAKRAMTADDFYAAVWTFSQYLRTECKHGNYEEKEYELLERVRDMFFGCLGEYNISLNDYQ